MDRTATLLPANRAASFAQTIRAAFAEVAALLFASATFQPQPSLEAEAREMVEPHLAILMHKRRKFFANDVKEHELWAKELDAFVGRTFYWPTPAATEVFSKFDRRRVVQLVDHIVAQEQVRQNARAVPLPATSRFGASWAD